MKIFPLVCSMLLLLSWANAQDNIFVASTPASNIVRSFLGISLPDSVEFIRWKLLLKDDRYELECNYGIGKPNTNGFIGDGKKITVSGSYQTENNYYRLSNGAKLLGCFKLNADLLHIVDENGHLLAGNGGWAYTLNNVKPAGSTDATIIGASALFKDSIIYTGRTPCQVPGVVQPGRTCYKLKWKITFYSDQPAAMSGTFITLGTTWRKQGGITGTWEIIKGKKGQAIYRLTYKAKTLTLHLLKPDGNVLIFTDANGIPLVGNEDFSYTLSKY